MNQQLIISINSNHESCLPIRQKFLDGRHNQRKGFHPDSDDLYDLPVHVLHTHGVLERDAQFNMVRLARCAQDHLLLGLLRHELAGLLHGGDFAGIFGGRLPEECEAAN